MVLEKIEDFNGMPPCPRMHFAMTSLQNKSSGHQLLVIFGGRNDSIFSCTNNVALNDVCIYNINTNTWEALAMYGQIPISRWDHVITHLNGDTREDE
jgi:hypothetical protein